MGPHSIQVFNIASHMWLLITKWVVRLKYSSNVWDIISAIPAAVWRGDTEKVYEGSIIVYRGCEKAWRMRKPRTAWSFEWKNLQKAEKRPHKAVFRWQRDAKRRQKTPNAETGLATEFRAFRGVLPGDRPRAKGMKTSVYKPFTGRKQGDWKTAKNRMKQPFLRLVNA